MDECRTEDDVRIERTGKRKHSLRATPAERRNVNLNENLAAQRVHAAVLSCRVLRLQQLTARSRRAVWFNICRTIAGDSGSDEAPAGRRRTRREARRRGQAAQWVLECEH